MPSRTTTVPTIGFGAVRPHPRSANASARRMNAPSPGAASGSLDMLEGDAEAHRAVGARLVGASRLELVERIDRAASHLPQLADDLEHGEVRREIDEVVRPCE